MAEQPNNKSVTKEDLISGIRNHNVVRHNGEVIKLDNVDAFFYRYLKKFEHNKNYSIEKESGKVDEITIKAKKLTVTYDYVVRDGSEFVTFEKPGKMSLTFYQNDEGTYVSTSAEFSGSYLDKSGKVSKEKDIGISMPETNLSRIDSGEDLTKADIAAAERAARVEVAKRQAEDLMKQKAAAKNEKSDTKDKSEGNKGGLRTADLPKNQTAENSANKPFRPTKDR